MLDPLSKGVKFMSTLKRLSLLSPDLSQISLALPQLHDSIDTPSNRCSCIFAFQAWIVSTGDILYNMGYPLDSITARIGRLTTDCLLKTEPSLVLKCSKLAYDILIDFISTKKSTNYASFKDQLTTCLGDSLFADAFVAPVNKLLSRIFLDTAGFNGCWSSNTKFEVRACCAYFGFLIKVPLTNTALEIEAISDYKAMEESYPKLDITNPYLKPLKRIITEWMRDFRYNGDKCKHGKGAVADAKSFVLDKYRNLCMDTRLEYLFKREGFLGIYDYLPLGASEKPLDRCSRIVFVPKNVTKLRTISMEPASLQYVQQGVMSELYDYFDNHHDIKNHVKLRDQTQNMSLAYDGSITNKYATIDLSAASDSVSYHLIKSLTDACPELYRWLVGTRSDYTLTPDGERIKLNKFAPMGSALCFPMETIVFAGIAKLATLLAHERGLTCDSATGIYSDFYSVYGDDIIIPRQAYSITADILASFNFKINDEKSYCDSPFKESCGGNYYCGLDITPVRWKVELREDGSMTPESFEALCDIANACYDKGHSMTRAYIISYLRGNRKNPLFTNQKGRSPMIYSTHCTNFHLRKRTNKNLQKEEVIYDTIRPVRACMDYDHPDVDIILYYQAQRRFSSPHTKQVMSNNCYYNSKLRFLFTDVSQRISDLSIMEKVTKFARGKADLI